MDLPHTDGFPVRPPKTDAVLAMGERVDVQVDLGDGVFPLIAAAEGKTGHGLAIVGTSAGRVPPPTVRPAELGRRFSTPPP